MMDIIHRIYGISTNLSIKNCFKRQKNLNFFFGIVPKLFVKRKLIAFLKIKTKKNWNRNRLKLTLTTSVLSLFEHTCDRIGKSKANRESRNKNWNRDAFERKMTKKWKHWMHYASHQPIFNLRWKCTFFYRKLSAQVR